MLRCQALAARVPGSSRISSQPVLRNQLSLFAGAALSSLTFFQCQIVGWS